MDSKSPTKLLNGSILNKSKLSAKKHGRKYLVKKVKSQVRTYWSELQKMKTTRETVGAVRHLQGLELADSEVAKFDPRCCLRLNWYEV